MTKIAQIVCINNPVSALLVRELLRRGTIVPSQTLLITLRRVRVAFPVTFAQRLDYPARAPTRLTEAWRLLWFYLKAMRLISPILRSGGFCDTFIVNNDNLVCQEILRMSKQSERINVSVLAEGLMNYQEITILNRASWRSVIKSLGARLLGYQWRLPVGHLSGAYEHEVKAVYAFSAQGLRSPSGKIVVLPLISGMRQRSPRRGVLYLETALWQWMAKEKWEVFARSFADFVRTHATESFVIKPHPNYPPSDYLRRLLPAHEVAGIDLSIEEDYGHYEGMTVISHWCTGLMTLKLLDPEVRCIDFGYDYYSIHAYAGEYGGLELLRGYGVETVNFKKIPNITSLK